MKEITITGHVGRAPEVRVDPEGKEFANVGKGKTDWCDISVSGRDVDVVRNYVKKGSHLLIAGFPKVKAYLNKDNKPVAVEQIYSRKIELLSKKDEHNEPVYNLPPIDQVNTQDGALTSDDIPF